ncbi:ABC transporter ATP-binding protein [Stenomitos frigidus]|uniref:ABC-type quaternary amine transporter n=1 Tax=Stenomitos frigidus ULC18 TaxID=2107698 RepID=A0A2T1ER06_9CYAN|nr:ABC transporter ATP-binding protein [Stenomitos frigidus]PSB35177.1 ABC transporter ATP-binding protein [Stenomitos frigidus ULC18]
MVQSVILRLEGITRQFSRSSAPAVNNLTLQLNQGDLLGLLGPSGCGKTTLLRLIAGFESPQAGMVTMADRTVAGAGHWVLPEDRDMGMVFQDYALFPHLTVAKNVAFGLEKRQHQGSRHTTKQVKHLTQEAIAQVGLTGLENRYPHELSGGQQQRVALARALAPQPDLILLDEPLSNLDSHIRLRLRQEVREILKATGTSGVLVTHDQEEALSIADWVAVMRNGHLEQFGTPETIYQTPATRFVAEFVTQANMLPATRKGDVWETEIGCFGGKWQEAEENARIADLMIRQEDLLLEPSEAGALVIRDRQFLGREHRYSLVCLSGRELYARLPADKAIPIGTRVNVQVTTSALQVFPSGY